MFSFIRKYGHLLTAFAVVVSTYSVNMACCYHFNQKELPEAVKKLRKF